MIAMEQETIPQGWHIKRFGDLVSISTGKKDANAQVVGGKYPFFTCAQGVSEIDNYAFDTEAVIVAGNGDFNVKYYKGKFDAYQRTYVIETKNDLIPIFLYYGTQYALPRITSGARGSTIQYLKIGDFTEFQFLVPPIQEQKKITEILSAVDTEIEKVENIIFQSKRLKEGLMRDLFTKGIGHKNFKKTEIGAVPEEWKISKLSEIATVERGKFSHRPRNAPEFYGGNIPFIQTGDVVNSNGKISSYTQTLNEKGLSVSRLFKKGTIVITIAANIGDTGILQFDSCFPDSLIGITPSEIIDPIYLEYYLRTQKEYLNSISTQSAQKNINLEKLNPLLIKVPPKNEQKKIADILSSTDEKISVNTKYKETLIKLKKGLMQDLLSGKVRVKPNK